MKGLKVSEVMTPNPDVVRAERSLTDLADIFVRTHHHGFPVLDKNDNLLGVVTVQDLERATSETSGDNLTVADITERDVVTASPTDPLSKALREMSERNFGRIPVVEPQQPTHLVGLLRRSDIVRAYRYAILRKLEHQHRRETLRLGRLTDTEIVEISLSAGMMAVGQPIKALKLPSQALITSIRRDDAVIIAHGETVLQPGDKMVILTQQGTAGAVREAVVGKE